MISKTMAKGGLTQKQEMFCNYYVECGNASEAYRRAFNASKMKDETVHKRASELLAAGEVTGRVKELRQKLQDKSDLTKERVLRELEAIMDSKITDYVALVTKEVPLPQSEDEVAMGEPPKTEPRQVLVFKNFSELTEKQVKAIESIKEGRNGIELKLHGKSWTIERICKMLGYDAPDKIAQTDTDGNPVGSAPIEHVVTFRDFSKKE